MLAEMVRAFSFRVGEQRGLDFLRKAVPILAHEYEYWMDEEKFHVARVKPSFGDHAGKTYVLNLYSSKTGLPRPESYREDVATAEGTVPTKRAALYDNIAAAALRSSFDALASVDCSPSTAGSRPMLNEASRASCSRAMSSGDVVPTRCTSNPPTPSSHMRRGTR